MNESPNGLKMTEVDFASSSIGGDFGAAKGAAEAEVLPLFERTSVRIGFALAAVALALVSFLFVAGWASSAEAHEGTLSALKSTEQRALQMTAGATAVAAGISMVPTYADSAVADKLLDLSGGFMIVLGAIYLEESLVTLSGLAAFKVLVPLGLLALAGWALLIRAPRVRAVLLSLGGKLIAFGLALFIVVPMSVGVSNVVQADYEANHQSVATNQQASDVANQAAATSQDQGQTQEQNNSGNILEDAWNSITNTVTSGVSQVTEAVSQGVADAFNTATDSLNSLIQYFAMMVITTCVIPLVVLVFLLWLIKVLVGIKIEVPGNPLQGHGLSGTVRRIKSK